jgi:hypothetical protein
MTAKKFGGISFKDLWFFYVAWYIEIHHFVNQNMMMRVYSHDSKIFNKVLDLLN